MRTAAPQRNASAVKPREHPLLDWKPPPDSRFDGSDYQHERDSPRLTEQIGRVWDAMQDGKWRTLEQIAEITGDPTPSISAQLRHLRRKKFGSHTVLKKYAGNGLYLYQVTRP
jgi:hypothetical protein